MFLVCFCSLNVSVLQHLSKQNQTASALVVFNGSVKKLVCFQASPFLPPSFFVFLLTSLYNYTILAGMLHKWIHVLYAEFTSKLDRHDNCTKMILDSFGYRIACLHLSVCCLNVSLFSVSHFHMSLNRNQKMKPRILFTERGFSLILFLANAGVCSPGRKVVLGERDWLWQGGWQTGTVLYNSDVVA